MKLPKEKLIDIIEKLYLNLVKEPKYNIYSKIFFIECLKQTLEVYKRYKNVKINLLLFKFDCKYIKLIKKSLRKSDLVAKYDNAFVIMLFETGEMGTYKVKHKLEKYISEKGIIINVNLENSVKDVLEEIENKIKIY